MINTRQGWAAPMAQTSPFSGPVVEFWMCKAMEWSQAVSPSAQKDVALHVLKLKTFLQQMFRELQLLESTREAMRRFPFVGQLLGRLCWNPRVTADEEILACLLQCLWRFYSEHPKGALELKANQWIQNILLHLSSGDVSSPAQAFLQLVACTPKEYDLKVLKDMLAVLEREVSRTCCRGFHRHAADVRCACHVVRAASASCAPLVARAEARGVIRALLLCPVLCDRATLSEGFLQAVSSALLSRQLALQPQEALGLWNRSLASLEESTLHLLESVLSNLPQSLHHLQQQVERSLLPNTSALHCSLFLVVSDIFRAALMEADRSMALRALVQCFTRCFLHALDQLEPQETMSLKVFFPLAPLSIISPLLRLPTDVAEGAWLQHLLWLSAYIQNAVEEEEEEECARWLHSPSELWFLVVQAGHWVDVAAQLLVTSDDKSSAPLLWLVTFYHCPLNLQQQRRQALVVAEETLSRLRYLFSTASPPVEHVQSLLELMSSCTSCLTVHLLLSFSIFSHGPLKISAQLFNTADFPPALRCEALALLASIEHRLDSEDVCSRWRTLWDCVSSAEAGVL